MIARKALNLAWIMMGIMALAEALVAVDSVTPKSLLHLEPKGDRVAISCTDHHTPVVKSLKNEPVVIVDCERAK